MTQKIRSIGCLGFGPTIQSQDNDCLTNLLPFQNHLRYQVVLSKRDMAKGKKTGGKSFEKGISGNPKGRPPDPPEVKAIKALSKAEFTRVANEYLWCSKTECDQKLKAKGVSMFERAVGATIKKAADGDLARLNMILDRIIGKPRDKMELTIPKPFVVLNLDGKEVMELGAEVKAD